MNQPSAPRLFSRKACALILSLLWAYGAQAQTGGGWLHGGLKGEYFSNSILTGLPSFVRRDVRVDFDWGAEHAPGGSPSPGYRDLGSDGYSIRWTGQLAARFSERYLIKAEIGGDEAVKLEIKPANAREFTTVFASSTGGTPAGSYSFSPGIRYDVRIEYQEFTGPAKVSFKWSSPSTAEEVIDSVSLAGLNVETYARQLWANLLDNGRDEWGPVGYGSGPSPERDADGWPLGDGTNIVWEGARGPERAGTYLLQFKGRAQVTIGFNYATFRFGTSNAGSTLPFGAGYDPIGNTTSALLDISTSAGILYLTFTNTRRNPSDTTATGVSEVKLMAPTVPGGSNPHASGSYFTETLKTALERYTTLRWILNFDTDQNWTDRVRPNYSSHSAIGTKRYWEQMVLLSNETGKDLYVCLAVRATDDYLTKVAQLIRYGSDGVNPYTSEQANPVFPPLNPNLRVIVERENEIWNYAFANFGNNVADLVAAANADTPDWRVVNYDGAFSGHPQDAWQRWHALRTVRASQIFRRIWGDAAMNTRVRVIYEYQYDNANNTAQAGLSFIDNYFNNADGSHVADPQPVNSHLWGAGGAVYYGSGNPQGVQTNFAFANAGLEQPALTPGQARPNPESAGWSFTGTAGLYRAPSKTPGWSNKPDGAPANSLTQPQSLGCRFTVGANPVAVTSLGRWVAPGSSRTHNVRLLRASDRVGVADAEVNLRSATAGEYLFRNLERPVLLTPHTSYYLLSSEDAGGDPFFSATPLTPEIGLTIDGRVSATYGNPAWDSGTWTFVESEAGARTFGPVNLRIIADPVGPLGYPPDPPEGTQAAWLAGTGEMSQTLFFAQAGTFALRLQAAAKENLENSVRFFFDNTMITPDGSYHGGARSHQWVPGEGWSRDYRRYENNTTYVFEVPAPGQHTLRIVGLGLGRYEPLTAPTNPNRCVYFDQLEIVSADALFAGGIPSTGEATGQVGVADYVAQLNRQARYAQAYGLQVVAYEGGWSLGGDFGSTAFQNWCKHHDPRAKTAQLDSINAFARSGGRLYVFGTYETWPGEATVASATFPLTQAVDDFNTGLPPEANNGLSLPRVLTAGNAKWSINTTGSALNGPGGWMCWNVLVARATSFQIATTTSAGGGAIVEWDGTPIATIWNTGGTNAQTLRLTQGLHTVRVRSTRGSFVVSSVAMTQPGAPDAPAVLSAVEGDGSMELAWEAPATGPAPNGYEVLYGTVSGDYPWSKNAGTAKNLAVTGLTNGTPYYVAVAAYNGAGLSLPSVERVIVPVAPGQITSLARWEFSGLSGLEGVDVSAAPSAASGNVRVSALTRGPGLSVGYNQHAVNTFASGPASSEGNNYGQNFAEAKTRRQFYTFTVAPVGGRSFSLTRLEYRPFFQSALTALGSAVTWSVDGANFLDAPAARGTPVAGIGAGALHTVELSGIPALQNTTNSVTLRIYLWGIIRWGCSGLGGAGDDLVLFGSFDAPIPSRVLAPNIVTQPKSVSVPSGQNAVLSVVATGTAPLSYQWLYNGKSLAGATFSTLVLADVQPAKAGRYSVLVSNSAGFVQSAEVTLTVIDPASSTTRGQFDEDGQTDIVFEDASGALAVWFTVGATLKSASLLHPDRVSDPGFRIVGSADFDQDGNEDLVFQHVEGTLAVWYMRGITLAAGSYLDPSHPGDRNWRVAAIGDFDGDKKPDLLFQHTDGTLAFWYLDGIKLRSAALLSPANSGAVWKAVGAGDFDGDRVNDVLFQHQDGTLAVWLMKGATMASVALLNPASPDSETWRVASVADRNRDGKPDLLFQRSDSGTMVIWFMDGTRRIYPQHLNPPEPRGTWKVVAP